MVVPFLIVYAFLFIVRGAVRPGRAARHHRQPVRRGGRRLVALAFLVLVLWGMSRLLNGCNRLVFWLGQLITAGGRADFLLDSSSGEPQVPAVVLVAALLALVLSVLPPATRWVR